MSYQQNRGVAPNRQDFQGGSRGGRGRGRGGGGNFAQGSPRPARPQCLTGEGAIFPIEVEPNALIYRYDVEIRYKKEKLNGDVIDSDFTAENRSPIIRQLCYEILSHIMDITQNFGNSSIKISYDNRRTLLSSHPFHTVYEQFSKNDLPENVSTSFGGNGTITVKIYQNTTMPTIDLNDLEQYQAEELLLNEDRTLRQMLEIILSQNAVDSGNYDVVRRSELYRKHENKIGYGLCTRVGSSKGVRIIETETKKPNGEIMKEIKPALVIDFKKSPFYCSGKFIDLVTEFLNGYRGNEEEAYREAEKVFKNIRLTPIYQKNRVLQFTKFTSQPFSKLEMTNDDGVKTYLVDYFRNTKNIQLTRANMRGATCGSHGDFPLELLQVVPNQKLDLDIIPKDPRDAVHNQNSVTPQVRYDNIMDEVRHLNFNNDITESFGISLNLEPIEKATVLQFDRPEKPKILIGKNKIAEPNEDGRFSLQFAEYFQPSKIKKWAVLFSTQIDGMKIKNVTDEFVKTAKERGINFETGPSPYKFSSTSFPELQKIFQKIKEEGICFVLMIDSIKNEKSHGILKLMERMFEIVTQHVTLEVFTKTPEQKMTLGNILLKFNVKNGGINYVPQFSKTAARLDINNGKILVVGYDVSHPMSCVLDQGKEKEMKMSVVGISGNYVLHPSVFVGDFFFQEKNEMVDRNELTIRIKRMLIKIDNCRDKKLPEIIVIVRDGVSEGQFQQVLENELPAIEAGCASFDAKYKPKILLIVATKRHHKRFFEGKDGKFVNPAAGSFVDGSVTRPDGLEFFMACHKAIKGTAKFVQVSVIKDEVNATRDELKHFLHSLCYGHQIVTSPTSLPTPTYMADELATRGFELYTTLKTEAPNLLPRNPVELTNMLGYSSVSFDTVRFNA